MKNILVDEKKLFKVLMDLISIDSTNPSIFPGGKGEKEIAEYIKNYLKRLSLDVTAQEVRPERPNIIAVLKGKERGRTLMLNGHMDTVSKEGMEIGYIKPEFKDGRIYGRGSIDMKAGLAMMMIAVDSIIRAKIELQGDLILAFVVDEEFESAGTEALLREYNADSAIVCEPTDLSIGIAHKGFVWVEVDVYGKSAHGSKPEEGVDAIAKAGKFLREMEIFTSKIYKYKKHSLLGTPSFHFSFIKGGKELSTYPDHCHIKLERRTIPGESLDDVRKEIEKVFMRINLNDCEFKGNFHMFFSRPPLEISKDERIVRSLRKAYKYITRKEAKYAGLSFWTDGAILKEAGIPAVIFGPSGSGLHSNMEYADFESVKIATEVLIATILDFFGHD